MIQDEKIAISFKNVSKIYRLYKTDKQRLLSIIFGKKRIHTQKKHANKNLSFTIKKGESVAVFGRNGAGKSTMLKIITGVTIPDSGDVHVNGRVSALLELTAGFDSEFTGRENIYLRSRLMGIKTEQIEEYLQEIIDFAELDEYIDQPVRTYSSGMKARLGFAINASIDPEILIIDEALSVGDIKFQEKCRVKVRELMNQKHITVLLATHSFESAEKFCDRGIVMHDGELKFDGPIAQAIQKYRQILE